MSTESYIIRVYRRKSGDGSFVGVVEIVETQEKKSFVNFDELRAILNDMTPGRAENKLD